MKIQAAGRDGLPASAATGHGALRRLLLVCGIVSSPFYVVANDVVAATRYKGYSRISQAISELSAPGSPARPVLVPLIVVYELLLFAFGIGIWQSARGKRALRVTSGLLLGCDVLNVGALAFPMSQREDLTVKPTFADAMHRILLGMVTPLLVFAAIAAGAAGLGRRFRRYSILTLAVFVAGVALTWKDVARLAAGKPTPWLGVAERVFIGTWLLWFPVLGVALWRDRSDMDRAMRHGIKRRVEARAPARSAREPARTPAPRDPHPAAGAGAAAPMED